MAVLEYKNSLTRYRRYLQSVQSQPLLKASLYLVLSLTLIIILVAAALRPTLITISSLLGQIDQQRQLEARLVHKINLVKLAQQELARVDEKLFLLDEALPETAQVNAWTTALENIASQSGLAISVVRVSNIPSAQPVPVGALDFQIEATGQYFQIYDFVEILQNHRRLILPQSIGVSRTTTDGNQLNLTLTGFIAAYHEEEQI